ncbi:MAG TPA: class I SAM-dependent methyltransferase [Solirubrobacteraceae bacterium]|nr:class I SAM-dependent methyltransferase [Solirubrobacteraceae bacterium]
MDGFRESASRPSREGRRHPIFARFFDRLSRVTEHELGPHRDRLLAGLSGRVLEIGAGNGVNFGHYPPAVETVVALEPEPFMRGRAQHAATSARVAVRLVDGVASHLPFESCTFDAVVASLVLCSVPELATALSEIRRVLKDGGELRFMEHVRADRAAKARLQVMLDRSRIWPLLGGGCHCSRQTGDAIAAAGFRVTEFESLPFGPSWWITNPHVRGAARAP